jgi:hypothetical protein
MRLRRARDGEAAAAERRVVALVDVLDARGARRVGEDIVDERAERFVLAFGVDLEPVAVAHVAHGSRDGVTPRDALHRIAEADRLYASAQRDDRALHPRAARAFVIGGYVPRMDAARFPAVTGEALDGTPFSAPRDFAGTRTVALVGFALEHRPELETWVPYLDELVRRGNGVRARLFVGLGVPKIVRKGIIAAMKRAVTAPELRAATVPVFVDVEAFCRGLGIGDRAHLTILLVEPDARITWRGSGPFSEPAGASLTAALSA